MAVLNNLPAPTANATFSENGVTYVAIEVATGVFVWDLQVARTGGGGGSGLTSVSRDATLTGDGANNPLGISDAVRNELLLINGFFLNRGGVTGTRTVYTGSIGGRPSADYWFDTADSSWYDAATGGNRLIGFGGTS